jgi:hypothetical protein
MIDPKVLHAAVARRYIEGTRRVHPAENVDERNRLRLALIEADKAMSKATTREERLDISRRTVALASRYKLCGGVLADIPGHEGKRWKR